MFVQENREFGQRIGTVLKWKIQRQDDCIYASSHSKSTETLADLVHGSFSHHQLLVRQTAEEHNPAAAARR